MLPIKMTTCECRRVTAWRNLPTIAKGSTAYELTTSTAFVSFFVTAMLMRSKLRITIKTWTGETMAITRSGTPHWRVHPGEVLREEFLKPLKLSAYALAKRIRVPAPRVNDIVLQKRGITADTAVRLAKFFGTSEQFWLNLQAS